MPRGAGYARIFAAMLCGHFLNTHGSEEGEKRPLGASGATTLLFELISGILIRFSSWIG